MTWITSVTLVLILVVFLVLIIRYYLLYRKGMRS